VLHLLLLLLLLMDVNYFIII